MDLKMVSYLAELGKLEFTEDELKNVAKDMTGIINLMDTIKEIDVTYDPYKDNKNIYINDLREDKAQPSMETKKVLSNAENVRNCFYVPKVVE